MIAILGIILMVFNAAVGLQANVRCINEAKIYVDGDFMGSSISGEVWTANITEYPTTMAIKCHSDTTDASVLVSLSNGLVSDSTWRCATAEYVGWFHKDIGNIQDWFAPHFTPNGQGGYEEDPSYFSDANWLSYGSSTLFCRGIIGPVAVTAFCFNLEGYVYIDGDRQPGDSAEQIWRGVFNAPPLVLGIRCDAADSGTASGGIIADIYPDFVTDMHWRCHTNRFITNWNQAYYDITTDSGWVLPYIIGLNEEENIHYFDPGFPMHAHWIWYDQYFSNTDDRILCRGAVGMEMNGRCDNDLTLFIDVQEFDQICHYPDRFALIIPKTTQIIAAQVYNGIRGAGILLRTSDGFVTDNKKWRCSRTFEVNWEDPSFDDSHWEVPTLNEGGKGVDSEFSSVGATWIWPDNIQEYETVYCRGKYNCGCSHLCVVHEDGIDYHCECPPTGYYIKEDRFCEDINECLLDNGGCHDVCVNTAGSYHCECYPCTATDSCTGQETANHTEVCQNTCIATSGPKDCYCQEGLVFDDATQQCLDVDECRVSHECGLHKCVNDYGSYHCICESGYTGSDNNKTCVDVNECEESFRYCAGDQICHNTNGSFSCCPPGYKREDNSGCIAISECEISGNQCIPPTTCFDTDGSFICCAPGYQGTEFDTCIDIDECQTGSHACGQLCTNTNGSYKCSCDEGHTMSPDGVCTEEQSSSSATNINVIVPIVAVLFAVILIIVVIFVIIIRRKSQKQNTIEDATAPGHAYHNVANGETTACEARSPTPYEEPPYEERTHVHGEYMEIEDIGAHPSAYESMSHAYQEPGAPSTYEQLHS